MEPVVRRLEPEERPAFRRTKDIAFGMRSDPALRPVMEAVWEPDRMVAGFDGEELVSTGVAYSFRTSVPGAGLELATAGIGGITVLPTHRRRGLLTAMMRHLLDDARERGEPLSLLWASEPPIYPRFGFGEATTGMSWRIGRDGSAFHRGVVAGAAGGYRVRLLGADPDKAVETIRPVHDGVRRGRPGMIDRTPAWWRRRSHDPLGEQLVAVVEGAGGVEAYAVHKVSGEWGCFGPDNRLEVREAMALTPGAEAALWRYLFDVDLVQSVSAWGRPPDEPLQWMLANPRRLERSLADGAWLRLVDLPVALAGRRYAAPVAVVFEVADPFCPWNAGRWLLEGGPDGAECTSTGRPPDLSCGVAELGAAFLGGTPLEGLRRAARLSEHAAGTARRADAAFLSDPRPWAVTWF